MSPSPSYILILSILTLYTHLNGKNRIENHFFILYHDPQFAQKMSTFVFYVCKNRPLYLKIKSFFSFPKQFICIFPENIREKTVSH